MILKAFRVVYNEKYSRVSELGRIANRTFDDVCFWHAESTTPIAEDAYFG